MISGNAIEAQKSVKHLLTIVQLINEDIGVKPDKQEGVEIRWSFFDMIFLNKLSFKDANVDQDELHRRLRFASDFMRKEDKNMGMFKLYEDLITSDALENIKELLRDVKLFQSKSSFGMKGDISHLKEDPHHKELHFRRVSTQKELDDFTILNTRVSGISEEPFLKHLKASKLWTEFAQVYVGYNHDEQAVCCASSFPINNTVHLLGVATDPAFQRRGYGETVSRKAFYEGRKAFGFNQATLTASTAGRPIYEKIGLKVTCTTQTLMLENFNQE